MTVAGCRCLVGPEWSGHPNPKNPDNEWICDDCGRVIPAEPEGSGRYVGIDDAIPPAPMLFLDKDRL